MSGIVVTNPPRADREVVDAFAQHGVATIHEAQGRTGLLSPRLRPVWASHRIAGSAVTATVAPGDNTTIGVAVEQCTEGDVLVVVPTAPCELGYVGDLLATSLQVRGVRGLVIETGVRDVPDLEAMGFPVWSTSVCAEGTTKGILGDVNVPISIGGRMVHPGDIVVADRDGVVIVPRLRASTVLKAAQAREEKESRARARYEGGEIALDVNGMRPLLEQAGIRYVDHADWVQEQRR